MNINPLGPVEFKKMKPEEPKRSWIETAKEHLCEYLSQIYLTKTVKAEWIEIESIEKKVLHANEVGDERYRMIPEAGGAADYEGFTVHFTYEGKAYPANMADVRGLRILFPEFRNHTLGVNRELILKLAHYLHPVASPEKIKVEQSAFKEVYADTLMEHQQPFNHERFEKRIRVFSIKLNIASSAIYEFYVTQDGKFARNLSHSSKTHIRNNFGNIFNHKKQELIHYGNVFFLTKCPKHILDEAKIRMKGELIDEEKVSMTFSDSSYTSSGWRLTFSTGNEIFIDESDRHSVVISK